MTKVQIKVKDHELFGEWEMYNQEDDGVFLLLDRDVRTPYDVQLNEPEYKFPYMDELDLNVDIIVPDGLMVILDPVDTSMSPVFLEAGDHTDTYFAIPYMPHLSKKFEPVFQVRVIYDKSEMLEVV
jgi:hypothetical protein